MAAEGNLFDVPAKEERFDTNGTTLHTRDMSGLSCQNRSLGRNDMAHDVIIIERSVDINAWGILIALKK